MRVYNTIVEKVSTPYPGFIRVRLQHPDFIWSRPIGDFYIKFILLYSLEEDQHAWVGHPELSDGCEIRREIVVALDLLLRTYTIAEVGEGFIDVDCALHDNPGPGTQWFIDARKGDKLEIIAPSEGEEKWATFIKTIKENKIEELIAVVDPTALPAAMNIAEELVDTRIDIALYDPEHMHTVDQFIADKHTASAFSSTVFKHMERLSSTEEVEEWLMARLKKKKQHSQDPAWAEDEDQPYIWDIAESSGKRQLFFAGESGLIRLMRRLAIEEYDCEKKDISFMGYWKK